MRGLPLLPAIALACASAAPAAAHHSFSSFDMTSKVAFEGDVAEVEWTNPHAWMTVDVKGADGAVERWNVEFNSPNNLTRQGWKRTTIKVGDHVKFVVSPLRDGRPGGLFYEVTLPSGELIQDPMAKADAARRAQGAGAQTAEAARK